MHTSQFEGTLRLNFPENVIIDKWLFEFCQLNRELKIEHNSAGEIIIMPPAGTETGGWNAEFNTELGIWNNLERLLTLPLASNYLQVPLMAQMRRGCNMRNGTP